MRGSVWGFPKDIFHVKKRNFDNLFNHINNKHKNVRFSMEITKSNNIAFPDVLVTKKDDRTLAL